MGILRGSNIGILLKGFSNHRGSWRFDSLKIESVGDLFDVLNESLALGPRMTDSYKPFQLAKVFDVKGFKKKFLKKNWFSIDYHREKSWQCRR